MLSRWLYPLLRDGEGPKAASRMFSHLNGDPLTVSVAWIGAVARSICCCLPLCIAQGAGLHQHLADRAAAGAEDLLSASASYRTLVHHYSLPLAAVAVVARVEARDDNPNHNAAFPGCCAGPWPAGWRWPSPGSFLAPTSSEFPNCKPSMRPGL